MNDIERAIEVLKYYKPKENELIYERDATHKDVEFFDLAISALEKQIPKKPVKDREYTLCPNCKKVEIDWLDNYCHGCSQRLDWSVEE